MSPITCWKDKLDRDYFFFGGFCFCLISKAAAAQSHLEVSLPALQQQGRAIDLGHEIHSGGTCFVCHHKCNHILKYGEYLWCNISGARIKQWGGASSMNDVTKKNTLTLVPDIQTWWCHQDEVHWVGSQRKDGGGAGGGVTAGLRDRLWKSPRGTAQEERASLLGPSHCKIRGGQGPLKEPLSGQPSSYCHTASSSERWCQHGREERSKQKRLFCSPPNGRGNYNFCLWAPHIQSDAFVTEEGTVQKKKKKAWHHFPPGLSAREKGELTHTKKKKKNWHHVIEEGKGKVGFRAQVLVKIRRQRLAGSHLVAS